MRPELKCDIAILGGGLAGCLIALALTQKRPDLDVRIVDQGAALGGNHIWSFFDSDVAGRDRWLVDPLVCHRWTGYDVAFPGHTRTLDAVYQAIESERLDFVVRERMRAQALIIGDADDYQIAARHIIDARGPGDLTTLDCGWQKFVGMSVHIPGGHGLTRPIVMDASVAQIDGYRFVYCLPFDAKTLFIEDTYYSDTPDLDVPRIQERIIAYAVEKGWHTNGGGRVETGVLPVVMGGNFDAYWDSTGPDTAKAGLRAGLFHATTGYSLPDAVRLAVKIPDLVDLPPEKFAAAVRKIAQKRWHGQGFYRLLDAMLFRAAHPDHRYKVLERFYRLSPGLIGRFYAGQSTRFDMLRVLSGKPPVPIKDAIRALWGARRPRPPR
jgi:lycopene beta-cyclase